MYVGKSAFDRFADSHLSRLTTNSHLLLGLHSPTGVPSLTSDQRSALSSAIHTASSLVCMAVSSPGVSLKAGIGTSLTVQYMCMFAGGEHEYSQNLWCH
jgi:hypothetical protein